jgi:hypothetical protein
MTGSARRLEGWGGPWFETRLTALLTMRPNYFFLPFSTRSTICPATPR